MRIVSVCRVYPTQRPGGMPHVAMDRAEELARQGFDIHVLTTGSTEHQQECTVNGVTVHHLLCPPQSYSAEFADRCVEACERLRPNILHLDSADLSRPWWTVRPGGPQRIAVTMHGVSFGGWLTKWAMYRTGLGDPPPAFPHEKLAQESDALNTFDRVLAISRHELYLLEDLLGVECCRLVENPIAPYFFDSPAAVETERGDVLCAAISGHEERGFRWAKQAAELAGIKLRVMQSMPRNQMPQQYDRCSALVLPTCYHQGFDLTIAEAIARGRPVIVSATGSYRSEAERYGDGYHLIPVGDIGWLSNFMKAAVAGELAAPDRTAAEHHRPDRHVCKWFEAITT